MRRERPKCEAVFNARGSARQLEERMRQLAARQHAVIARAQLVALGFHPRAIDRRIEAGVLRRLHRGVYLVGPVAPPFAGEMAAVLAGGDGAVLSHRSAARLWGLLPGVPDPEMQEITVVGRDPRPRRVRVHRIRRIEPDETTTWKLIPITTPARTLIDNAAELDERQVERALAEAYRRRLVRVPVLAGLLARHAGRPGTPVLRRLLEDDRSPSWTRSEAEERFLALIREADLPRPEVNARAGPYEVDFLWREHRLVVEVDSWTFHSDRKAFEADRRRDQGLAALGFRVIRITWRQMRDGPVAVVARIAGALASPS